MKNAAVPKKGPRAEATASAGSAEVAHHFTSPSHVTQAIPCGLAP